jgi:hypothetical protein
MDSEEMALLDKRRKCQREVNNLKDDITTRRKILETKLSTQSSTKVKYYLSEKERDRASFERKEELTKTELESKLVKLKREYDAEVESITNKLENKIRKLKEDSESYQKYCDAGMYQEVNEEGDLVLVKYKEQLRIAQEHYDKADNIYSKTVLQNDRYRADIRRDQERILLHQHEKEKERERLQQQLAAQQREQSIRNEVKRCKEEKEKDREIKENQVSKTKKKQTISTARIQEYANAIYKEDLPLFNLLTISEKTKIIESQNLDIKVKEYEDNLIHNFKEYDVNDVDKRYPLQNIALAEFRDKDETSRYRQALGEQVLNSQRKRIVEYAQKYMNEEE